MAIFESTIFENLSGTVGNVTSYKLKDKQVARAKIFSRKDAKTLQQLKQRTRMKTISLFKHHLTPILASGFCTSSRKDASNRFLALNMGKVEVDDELNVTIDPLQLAISDGPLALPVIEAKIDHAGRRIIFRWKKQPLMPYMYKNDCLYGAIYETQMGRSRKVILGTRAEAGETTWELPKDWNSDHLVIYGFATTADGQKSSPTLGVLKSEEL